MSDDIFHTLSRIYDELRYVDGRLRLDTTLEIVLDRMTDTAGGETYVIHWEEAGWANDEVASLTREQYQRVLIDLLNSPDLPSFRVKIEDFDEVQAGDNAPSRFFSIYLIPRSWGDTGGGNP